MAAKASCSMIAYVKKRRNWREEAQDRGAHGCLWIRHTRAKGICLTICKDYPVTRDKHISMATILRLRGLDSNASAEDIRSFFGDFQIPDGGVFIVGGAFGEAFIAFHSDEDGVLALQLNGHFLKDSQVDLHISSMVEAEHKFDSFLKRKKSFKPCTKKQTRSSSNTKALTINVTPVDSRTASREPSDTTVGHAEQTLHVDSLDTNAAFLLGVCTLLQGLPSQTNVAAGESPVGPSSPDQPVEVIPGYIRVFGLPFSCTKQDICHFFKGLNVQEVLMNVKLGVGYGSLVKFGSFQDATDALSFNNCSLGSTCVEVRTATEKMWLSALQESEDACHEKKLKQGPLKDTLNYKKDLERPRKRQYNEDFQHKSFKKLKANNQSTDAPSDNRQHIIKVSNLPVTITKTEIKELFGCPNIAHTNVQHLLDAYKNRTDTAFVMFNNREDYDYAINLSGCHVGSQTIDVTPITKEEMRSMMSKAKDRSPSQNTRVKKKQTIERTETTDREEQSRELCTTARTCVYVRNMPANVRRSQIRALFTENKLRDEDITLLHDCDGMCIGEAVVRFQSQTNAALALMHHGMEFLGSKLLLTPINVKQMENILANDRY